MDTFNFSDYGIDSLLAELTKQQEHPNFDDFEASSIGKTDVDDRLASPVDSPFFNVGSPLSGETPSPRLSNGTDSSPISPNLSFGDALFDFNESDMYTDVLKTEIKTESTQDSNNVSENNNWMSERVLSTDEINKLLGAPIPYAADEYSVGGLIIPNEDTSYSIVDTCTTELDCGLEHPDITEQELVELSVKDLNKRLNNYPESMKKLLKQKRRTLKNRGYAQNCRSKRVQSHHELVKDNESLMEQLSKLKKKVFSDNIIKQNMQTEIDTLRKKVCVLERENSHLKLMRNN